MITNSTLQDRIKSVDFFRGVIMFLLAGEATGLYEHLAKVDNSLVHSFADQFEHHEWHGLHFWDLIQPFFMFIVGVAIPFAVANREKKGDTQKQITQHAIKRALLLLFFGWALYFIDAGRLVFRFQNVLAQLSFTYLVAFLIRNKSFNFQLILSLAILLVYDLAYRFFSLQGFNHPWTLHENLGAWFNNKIEGEINSTQWASLNFISTTAHTIWGVLCGKLLMSTENSDSKIKKLIVAGVVALIIGFGLDLLNITPIIKKIATSSFVFASGGWAMLGLAFCYWLIDVKKKLSKSSLFFIIVGANSIFIYLFFSLRGTNFLTRIFSPFTKLFFSFTGSLSVEIITSLFVWAAMWYLCYWLYQKKIFFRI